MTRETQKKWKWAGTVLALVLAGIVCRWFQHDEQSEPYLEGLVQSASEEPEEISYEESTLPALIRVHVSGAVRSPDRVYTLFEGARVEDALKAAGGYTAEADLSKINLAGGVEDGQKIYVPRQGEDWNEEEKNEESGGNDLTDLNKADKIELDALPGIGPSLAQRIVDYREEHGAFQNIEEIKNVKGIGDAMFEKLRQYITVR